MPSNHTRSGKRAIDWHALHLFPQQLVGMSQSENSCFQTRFVELLRIPLVVHAGETCKSTGRFQACELSPVDRCRCSPPPDSRSSQKWCERTCRARVFFYLQSALARQQSSKNSAILSTLAANSIDAWSSFGKSNHSQLALSSNRGVAISYWQRIVACGGAIEIVISLPCVCVCNIQLDTQGKTWRWSTDLKSNRKEISSVSAPAKTSSHRETTVFSTCK